MTIGSETRFTAWKLKHLLLYINNTYTIEHKYTKATIFIDKKKT